MKKIEVIRECTRGELTFPEIIKQLADIEIERYYADLIRMEKTYYASEGDTYVESLNKGNQIEIPDVFQEEKIIEALKLVQEGKINYSRFLEKIRLAGCVNYTVFLSGKQAHYLGRKGEIHIETFPAGEQ